MSDESTDPASRQPPQPDQTPSQPSGRRTNGANHADARPAADDEPTGDTPRRRPQPTRRPPRPTRALQRTTRSATTDAEASAARQIGHVEADHLELHQGSIGSATARSVAVHRGALGSATAEEVLVRQAAVGGARAQRVNVEIGAIGGALAGDVRVNRGFIRAAVARDVSIEQGGARTIVANTVTFGRQGGALLVLARRVEGGRFLLDWRGALAFGAAFAVVSAFLRGRLRDPRHRD